MKVKLTVKSLITKIISFIIIANLLSASVVFADVANVSDDSGDNAESVVESCAEIDLINDLKLAEFDSGSADEYVTNSVFSMDVAYIFGVSTEMYDVNALNYLVTNNTMLNISSYADGNITYAQALKAIVSLLGYDLKAYNLGGYPSGYITVANQLDITENVDCAYNEDITYRMFAKLLYNCLDVSIMTINSIENGGISYTAAKDKNVLSEYFDIYKDNGRMNANEFTNLTASYNRDEGHYEIDGRTFSSDNDYNSFIGRNVEYYYKKDGNSKKMLLHVEIDSSSEKYVNVCDDDLTSWNGRTVSYIKENGKKAELKLSGSYALVYNGKIVTDFGKVSEIAKDFKGSIDFVDTDRDGIYDFVNVRKLRTIFVGYVSAVSGDIYDKDNVRNYISYDPDDSDYYVQFTDKSGADAEISNVKVNNVLDVYESFDGKLVYVQICSDSVTGAITGIGVSDNALYIDDKKYDVTDAVKNKFNELTVGENVEAYFGINGKIAGVVNKSSSYSFGYIQKAMLNTAGINDELKIRVFTLDSKFVEYTLDKKTKIDDNAYKNLSDLYSYLWDTAKNTPKYDLVKYDVREDGTVNSIYTENSKDKLFKIYSGSGSWYSTPLNFSAKFMMPKSASVIVVPIDDLDNDDRYGATTPSYLENGTTYTITGYSTTENDMVAQTAVVKLKKSDDKPIVKKNNNFAVFKRLKLKTGTDEQEHYYIECTLLSNGSSSEILVDKLSDIGDLSEGDIFRYATNISKYLSDVQKVYDKNDGVVDASIDYSTSFWSASLKYSIPYNIGDTYITSPWEKDAYMDEYDMSQMVTLKLQSPQVYIYHKNADRFDNIIEKTTAQNIATVVNSGESADKILFNVCEAYTNLIIIIRN